MNATPLPFYSYFRGAFFFTLLGLALSFWLGLAADGGWTAVFICSVLGILEVSLSFDNAVVNAVTLQKMNVVWRERFLTWGMLIAVFGMRLVFPLVIVGVLTHLGPLEALNLATIHPAEYARLMQSVHIPISAFGGAFLLLVSLNYFMDANKSVHWIRVVEIPLQKIGQLPAIEIAVAILALYFVSLSISVKLPVENTNSFLIAGLFGIVAYISVAGLSSLLARQVESRTAGSAKEHFSSMSPSTSGSQIARASAAYFIYLEILDAAFSFDGVVGAFAITNNLLIITIGLGIGALFVRSLTILLVDRGTLIHYRYIEHGAFYAIGTLAIIMFLNAFIEIPEVFTGLAGATLIAISFISSVYFNKKNPPSLRAN